MLVQIRLPARQRVRKIESTIDDAYVRMVFARLQFLRADQIAADCHSRAPSIAVFDLVHGETVIDNSVPRGSPAPAMLANRE